MLIDIGKAILEGSEYYVDPAPSVSEEARGSGIRYSDGHRCHQDTLEGILPQPTTA